MTERPASSFQSLPDLWHHRIRSTPSAEALTYRDDSGRWTTLNWREAGVRSRQISDGLLSIGLKREERCCILSSTRVEWILADLGVLCAGGATTTIYPSNTANECQFIASDSDARVIFCENVEQLNKLLTVREQLPQVHSIVVFEGPIRPYDDVITLSTLMEKGRVYAEKNPEMYDQVSQSVSPSDLATLIYTSGTTGRPKGVMLSHEAWVYQSEALDQLGLISPADRQFLFLPLSHIFGKVLQVVFIRLGVPTVIDGDLSRLIPNLEEISPTWMGAVPRIFEKAYSSVVAKAQAAGGVQFRLFNWSLNIGRQVSKLRQAGREPTGLLALKYAMADRAVFSKVRAKFGGNIRFFFSGGAPLSAEIAEFFHACDILILEGYGLTESGGVSTLNPLNGYRFGTVGKPLPGVEVKVAEDGELLIKSRALLSGYNGLPDESESALNADGWLHTGDLGSVLDSGHVAITGRKKDLIITAGGKNIGPGHFQGLLQSKSIYVNQVLMHGDRRNFCSALICINPETVGPWLTKMGVHCSTYAEMASKPEVKELIWQAVQSVNTGLPSYETVKKIALLPEDFSVENGLLTPSLKVKRVAVESQYGELLNAFYSS